ncbi:DNA binding protein, putative [Hepatocystis sp. ex Piliocolobus tephrosceles]|nr:DNA binding protein, putative [Hepatocystis sp. ex Piliocolobus tephrosceles]
MIKGLKKLYTCYSNSVKNYENSSGLSKLNFTNNIIYVNDKNVLKYEKSILQYFNTDILGFDTEFVFDLNTNSINNNDKKNYTKNKKSVCNNVNVTTNSSVQRDSLLNKKNELLRSFGDTYISDYPNNCDISQFNTSLINSIFQKKKKNHNTNNEYTKYKMCTKNKKLCLIQLSSDDICFVFNINKLNGYIPLCIKEILENKSIIKVCHDIKNDIDMFLHSNIEIKNVFDLYNYSIENYIYPPSLQSLVKIYLNKHLDKYYRLSNWLSDHLNEEQIVYAAIDAYASREIYIMLKKQNKINNNSFIYNCNNKNYVTDQIYQNNVPITSAPLQHKQILTSNINTEHKKVKNEFQDKKEFLYDEQTDEKGNVTNLIVSTIIEDNNDKYKNEDIKNMLKEKKTSYNLENIVDSVENDDTHVLLPEGEETNVNETAKCQTSQTNQINQTSQTNQINQTSQTNQINQTSQTNQINQTSKTNQINQTSQTSQINQTSQTYEYIETVKLHIINDLKNNINVKCSQINNIAFFEEMVFSNNSYKKLLYLKHVENNNYLIKVFSINYDEEINCCKEILQYLENKIV